MSIWQEPGRTFRVYRRDEWPERVEPLGTLAHLIAHAQALTPRAPERQDDPTVLEGTFTDFAVRDVLEVLSIGRLPMRLVAFRPDGSRVTLATRSGRLLACADPARGLAGVAALRSLLADPGWRFRVTRDEDAAPADPLGRLVDLLGGPAAGAAPEVLLDGTFAATPVADLLRSLGLTRQLVEVVLRDGAGPRGAMLIKAGQVLDARATHPARRGRAAFVELLRDPGRTFTVVRRSEPPDQGPVGSLAELLEAAAAPDTRLVLQGRFGDTGIRDLLETVALSRQRMEIRLAGERAVGRIVVKAGQLLEVERGALRGREAFEAVLADPGRSFRVARSSAPAAEPLGALQDWLAAAGRPGPRRVDPLAPLAVRLDALTAALRALEESVTRRVAASNRDRDWLRALAAVQGVVLLLVLGLLVRLLLAG